MLKIRIIHILSTCLICCALCAQQNQAFEVLEDHEINDVVITNENDKFLATTAGILRIDANGVVEEVYDEQAATAVAESPRHGMWFGTENGRIMQLTSQNSVQLDSAVTRINSMHFSGSDLWVGTTNGVYVISTRLAKVTGHYTTTNSKLPSSQVNEVYVDASLIKWIGTDHGVVRIENEKWKVYEKQESFLGITENSEGVWLASDQEIWLVDPYNRWSPTNAGAGLRMGPVKAIAADRQGHIFILSDALVKFDPYTDLSEEIDISDTAIAGYISLITDKYDNLWLGSAAENFRATDTKDTLHDLLNVLAVVTQPPCHSDKGSIRLDVSGGIGPYTYQWSDGVDRNDTGDELAAGPYAITVSDRRRDNHTLEVIIRQPGLLTAEIDLGGEPPAARALVTGGVAPYTYLWGDGTEGETAAVQGAAIALQVTDANSCTAKASLKLEPTATITIAETPSETIDAGTLTSISTQTLGVIDAATLEIGQTLRIEQLFFEADSVDFRQESYQVLDEIYSFLVENPEIEVEIRGHTNGLPAHDYCDRLSAARARTVAEYLYERGIATSRITHKGYGKRLPLASNATSEGRRKNQRVELKILGT